MTEEQGLKESKEVPKINLEQLHALNATLIRYQLANQLGITYGGERDLYQVLGYKTEVTYDDFYKKWKRGDISKVLIDKIPKKCWSNDPIITDTEDNDSPFHIETANFFKKYNIIRIMQRADRLMRMGKYAVLFLGFNGVGVKQLRTPVTPSESLELLYITPFSEKVAKVHTLVSDPSDKRYGKPLLYQIDFETTYQPDGIKGTDTSLQITKASNKQINSVLVHYSRIIHLIEDPLENEIEGTPTLEAIYNRLDDIDKILGGSAEMFWRNASPGKVASTKEGVTLGSTAKEDLKKQFDEYENNLRRWLTVEGIDVKSLETYMNSPRDFMEVQLNIIAIVTGIPKRILMGSERGELASSQDQDSFNNLIYERCEDICSPVFVKAFVDRMIEFMLLPKPQDDEYMVVWPKQTAIGARDKSEIAHNRAKTIKEYVSAPGADILIPSSIFLRDELGYDPIQIKEIEKARNTDKFLEEDIEEDEGDLNIDDTNDDGME